MKCSNSCGQCPVHESSSNRLWEPVFYKYTSLNQVLKCSAVCFPEDKASINILVGRKSDSCTLGPNDLSGSFNTVYTQIEIAIGERSFTDPDPELDDLVRIRARLSYGSDR